MRLLSIVLVVQQLTFGLPADAVVRVEAGKPLDTAALSGLLPLRGSIGAGASEFRGESTFSIPLVAPPGTGGLTPELSLRYASGSGNGPLGVGWSLSFGVPQRIERSVRDGAPEYDSTDRFEYGGARLVPTGVATGGVTQFVSERFDHSRIERVDGADYWRVLRPDGSRLYYGYHASRLDTPQILSVAPTQASCVDGMGQPLGGQALASCATQEEVIPAGIPHSWYLDRIEDRNGNVIQLFWNNLSDPGVLYPTTLLYSAHVGIGGDGIPNFGGGHQGSTIPFTRSISFGYEPRLDVMPTFRKGFRSEFRQRLATISIKVGALSFREYSLAYDYSPASGRSLLETVSDNGDGTSTAPFIHTFTYGDGGTPGWGALDATHLSPLQFSGLDVQGKRRDLGTRLVDLNLDGFVDVMGPTGSPTFLGSKNGFATPTNDWSLPGAIFSFSFLGDTRGVVLADLNGDLRPDLLQRFLTDTFLDAATPPNPGCTQGSSAELESGTIERYAFINTGSGWQADASHDPAPFPIDTTTVQVVDPVGETYPFTQSCPIETVPFASSLQGSGYDQGSRIVDVNGDGRDDIVYKRIPIALTWKPIGSTFFIFSTAEQRHGVLLNGPAGLGAGTPHYWHRGDSVAIDAAALAAVGAASFLSAYNRPRWQFPQASVDSPQSTGPWSLLARCAGGGGAPVVPTVGSGIERFVDLNADGLPDILEAWESTGPMESNALFNNGYNWQLATAAPENAAKPPAPFISVVQTLVGISPAGSPTASCVVFQDGSSVDNGWRVVDVNGDGGPDWVGGPSNEVRLWDARAPSGSLWRSGTPWSLPAGLSFAAAPFEDGAARLADVNADGLVDILVEPWAGNPGGAYLNQAEPPDLLETATTPLGAVTTLTYAPTTAFEDPPLANPDTPEGQIYLPRARWVLEEVRVDPGPTTTSGQPALLRTFDYSNPIYDQGDRAFRGFEMVSETNAQVVYPEEGAVQTRRDTHFHVSDDLAGRIARVEIFSDDGASVDKLRELAFEYASASAADSGATVTLDDFSMAPLDPLDPQAAAFTSFFALMGASPLAAESFLAFQIASEERICLTSACTLPGEVLVNRSEATFDIYRNAVETRTLGDPGDPTDDLTTIVSFALADQIGTSTDPGILLANQPKDVAATGNGSALPPGSTATRITRFFYDGSLIAGEIKRGNATFTERFWTPTWVRVEHVFDDYGNATQVSAPFDITSTPSEEPRTQTKLTYDPFTATFPVLVERAFGTPIELETALAYDGTGCIAPPGSGLACRITDPNGNVTSRAYDEFGRLVLTTGPGGFAEEIDYHDGDRATTNQRTRLALRVDPAETASPLNDPDAIVTELHFDGLGRALKRKRPGVAGNVAEQSLSYDAAGRLREATRWAFGGGGSPTRFEYDALGRLKHREEPDGSVMRISYSGRRQTVEDFLNGQMMATRKRISERDALGRLAAVEEFADPSGSTPAITSYRYDPFGGLAVVDNAFQNDISLCAAADPNCSVQSHQTRVFYDELGNRTQLDDPDTGTWLYVPDSRGRTERQTDPRGIEIVNLYDELDRLTTQAPPTAADLRTFVYGDTTTTVPNGVGRLVRIDDAEGYDEFEYDPAGNPNVHVRTLSGLRFDFGHTYDAIGRRSATSYPDGETASWHYDKRLLVGISTTGGTFTGDYVGSVGYDALDQVTALELGGIGGQAALQQAWAYDTTSSRLDAISASASGQSVAFLDYTIDGLGRTDDVSVDTLPLGGGGLENASFDYQYDGLDRLTQTSLAGDVGSATYTYDYDALGNLRKKNDPTNPGGFLQLIYDDPVRPHAVTEVRNAASAILLSYTYDGAGSVTSKQRVPEQTVTGFVYNDYGDSISIGAANSNMFFGVDGRRLRLSDGLPTGGRSLLFPEPGFEYLTGANLVNKHFFVGGRRVASSANTWTAPSATGTLVVGWSPPEPPPWAPLAVAGILALALLGVALRPRPAPGHGPVFRGATAATTALLLPLWMGPNCGGGPPGGAATLGTHGFDALFYATDRLGSTIVTVTADGVVQSRSLYGPFGAPMIVEGQSLHHGFTGGHEDPTGLLSLGPRHYDPEIGRFLMPDLLVPVLSNPQDLNRYSYVRNSPPNLVDPTGLAPACRDSVQGCPSDRRDSGGRRFGSTPFNPGLQLPDDAVFGDIAEAIARSGDSILAGGPRGGRGTSSQRTPIDEIEARGVRVAGPGGPTPFDQPFSQHELGRRVDAELRELERQLKLGGLIALEKATTLAIGTLETIELLQDINESVHEGLPPAGAENVLTTNPITNTRRVLESGVRPELRREIDALRLQRPGAVIVPRRPQAPRRP